MPGAGARLPDPAERDQRLVVDGLVVDVHQPGRDPLGQLQTLHHVAGQDAQRQPVLGAVRPAATASSRLGERRPPGRPGRRSPRRRRARSAARRSARSAGRTAPRRCRPRAACAPASTDCGDDAVDVVALPGVDDRAHRDVVAGRVADRQPVGVLGQRRGVVAGDRAATRWRLVAMQIWPAWLNDPNAPTDTAFSRSTSSSTISAELPPSSRCTRLSRFAAAAAMILPGAGGAGERDHPDQRVVDDRRADVRAAGQHVEQPRRQPGLLEDPGEHHAAAHRRARVGLAAPPRCPAPAPGRSPGSPG